MNFNARFISGTYCELVVDGENSRQSTSFMDAHEALAFAKDMLDVAGEIHDWARSEIYDGEE